MKLGEIQAQYVYYCLINNGWFLIFLTYSNNFDFFGVFGNGKNILSSKNGPIARKSQFKFQFDSEKSHYKMENKY